MDDLMKMIREGVRKEVERQAAASSPEHAARLREAEKLVMRCFDGRKRRIIAFIPARGRSKRVHEKNLQEIAGLSLLERTIACARAALEDAEIVVSTEDAAVRYVAERALGEVGGRTSIHRRPGALAGDHSQIEAAIDDWLTCEALGGTMPGPSDIIVLLQPTSPFRRAETVRECVAAVEAGDRPCVTVTEDGAAAFSGTRDDLTGLVSWQRDVNPGERPRTQDLAHAVVENGCVYAFTAGHFRKTRNRMAKVTAAVPISRWEALEIDTPEDLQAARLLAGGPVDLFGTLDPIQRRNG